MSTAFGFLVAALVIRFTEIRPDAAIGGGLITFVVMGAYEFGARR